METLSIVRIREKKCWWPGTRGWGLVFNGDRHSVWEDEKFWRQMVVTETDGGDRHVPT